MEGRGGGGENDKPILKKKLEVPVSSKERMKTGNTLSLKSGEA